MKKEVDFSYSQERPLKKDQVAIFPMFIQRVQNTLLLLITPTCQLTILIRKLHRYGCLDAHAGSQKNVFVVQLQE